MSTDQWNFRLSGQRDHLLEQTARVFDCNRARAVEKALIFTLAMTGDNTLHPTGRLQEAIDHPDMTPELADILTTDDVTLEYNIETNIAIDD